LQEIDGLRQAFKSAYVEELRLQGEDVHAQIEKLSNNFNAVAKKLADDQAALLSDVDERMASLAEQLQGRRAGGISTLVAPRRDPDLSCGRSRQPASPRREVLSPNSDGSGSRPSPRACPVGSLAAAALASPAARLGATVTSSEDLSPHSGRQQHSPPRRGAVPLEVCVTDSSEAVTSPATVKELPVVVVAPGPAIGCHLSAPSFAASPPAHDTTPASQSPTVTPTTPHPHFTVQATVETSRTTAPRTERIARHSSGSVPPKVSAAVTPPPALGPALAPPPAGGAAVTVAGHTDTGRREDSSALANSATGLTPAFSAPGLRIGPRACCGTSVVAQEPRGSRSISPGRESGSLQRIASTGALGRGADVASTATVQRRASGGPWRSSVVRTMSTGSGGLDHGGGSGACKSVDRGHGPPPKVVQSALSARPMLTGPQGTSQGRQVPCGTYSSSMIAVPPRSAQQRQQQQQQQKQPQTQSRIMRASSTPLQTIRSCKGSGGQVATHAPNSSFSRRP
jgi:hypothetical protein